METLTKYRMLRGLTRSQLSLRSGISQPTITRIENGKRNPGRETLLRLAAALNVEPSDLLPGFHNECKPAVLIAARKAYGDVLSGKGVEDVA